MDKLTSLIITKASQPSGSVRLHVSPVSSPGQGEVLVKFHCSPINPLDLAVIVGAYPVKPLFSHEEESILGFDGVAEVLELGPDVKSLEVGDFVVPARYGIGTWRSHAVLSEALLDRIPTPKDARFAAILRLGVATAWFLVERMSNDLRPGSWIVQNAGTSVVAQMVAQFALRKGIKVLSVVRDREPLAAAAVMDALSASAPSKSVPDSRVVTESELEHVKGAVPFAMAIDSVGGYSAQQLLSCLASGGTFVQHGFLAGTEQILPLDAASFWGRNLKMVSSRSSAQMAALSSQERCDLLAWFIELHNAGELKMPALGLDDVVLHGSAPEGSEQVLQDAVGRAKRARLGQRKQLLVWVG